MRRDLDPAAAGLDGIACFKRDTAGSLCKVFSPAGIQNGPGGIDHHAVAVRGPARRYRGFDIAALRSDTWNQQRQLGRERSDLCEFGRYGGSYHQTQLASGVPWAGSQSGHPFEQTLAMGLEHLQIGTSRVGCAAQQKDPSSGPGQPGLDRVETHVRVDRDRIGVIALEGLTRILLCSGSDITAFDIEDHGHRRMPVVNMPDECLKLIFCTVRCKVGSLWFEGADQIRSGVDDGRTELQDRFGSTRQVGRKAIGIGVESDAQERGALLPGLSEGQYEAVSGGRG